MALGHDQLGARIDQIDERLRRRLRREVVPAQADEICPRDELVQHRRAPPNDLAGNERPEHALPADGHEGARGRDLRPRRGQLVGDRGEHPARIATPAGRQRRGRDRVGRREAALDPSAGPFDVLEDGPAIEASQRDLGARHAEEVELLSLRGERIDPDQSPDAEPETRQRERGVGHRAAEAPAAKIVGRKVPRSGTDDHHDRAFRKLGCILQTPFLPFGVDRVFL